MVALKPVTLLTPASVTHVTATVQRSWKTRILTVGNGLLAFTLALLAYLQTINLGSFGITPERAVTYMAFFNLLQFVLMQVQPFRVTDVQATPGVVLDPPQAANLSDPVVIPPVPPAPPPATGP